MMGLATSLGVVGLPPDLKRPRLVNKGVKAKIPMTVPVPLTSALSKATLTKSTPIAQLRDQALEVRVLGDVFIKVAVLSQAHHAVVALGHHVVVVLNDDVGLVAVFKQDVQVLAHALDLDVVRPHAIALVHLLQLVLDTLFGLDAQGLTTAALALGDLQGLAALRFAGVDDDFKLFGHGAYLLSGGVATTEGCTVAWVKTVGNASEKEGNEKGKQRINATSKTHRKACWHTRAAQGEARAGSNEIDKIWRHFDGLKSQKINQNTIATVFYLTFHVHKYVLSYTERS